MIRILHVVRSMNHGGLEMFIMNIYRNINRDVIQFDFMVHSEEKGAFDDEIKSLGGRIYTIPPRNKGISSNNKALEAFFKMHPEYKVIHQHVSSLTYLNPLKKAKKYKVPNRIIHSHNTTYSGTIVHKYLHYFNKLLLDKYVTDKVACSDLAAKWLYGNRRSKDKKFKIVRNGIEVGKFQYDEKKRREIRRKLGISKDTKVIGHVGRFSHQKNHDFLIDIFKEISTKRDDIILCLIGDGNLRNEIEKKVLRLGLEKKVLFLGIQERISDFYQMMDIFVFPSHFEGLGMVIVEAQISGLKSFVSAEVIPKEVKLTSDLMFVPLDNNPKEWASNILGNLEYSRENNLSKVSEAGYNASQIAKELQEWYISKIKQVT